MQLLKESINHMCFIEILTARAMRCEIECHLMYHDSGYYFHTKRLHRKPVKQKVETLN